jgi:hypothetical protein
MPDNLIFGVFCTYKTSWSLLILPEHFIIQPNAQKEDNIKINQAKMLLTQYQKELVE